jgi:hypothetical protein
MRFKCSLLSSLFAIAVAASTVWADPPTLLLPSAMTVATTSESGATVYFGVIATDPAGGFPPVTCAPAGGSVFPLGTTLVTCSATGSDGTTSTGSFSVTVVPSGKIAGRVLDAGTAAPIANVQILVHSTIQSTAARVFTDADGRFLVSFGLLPGAYYIKTANNIGYVDQLYAGVVCVPCTLYGGTPVQVAAGQVTGGIEFRLSTTGHEVAGTVRGRNADGTTRPLDNATVYLTTEGTFQVKNTKTDAGGVYRFLGVPDGKYFVTVQASGFPWYRYGYGFAATASKLGDPLVVAGADRTGIDVTMSQPSTIRGQVTRTDSGDPASIQLRLYDAGGRVVSSGTTRAGGAFEIPNVGAGTYYLATAFATGLVTRVYRSDAVGGLDCAGCDITTGTPIVLPPTGTVVEGIHFSLSPGTRITGVVKNTEGIPLRGVSVDLYNSEGRSLQMLGGGANTDDNGVYTTTAGLPPGTYFARTQNITPGYQDVIYRNTLCPGCDLDKGTPIVVTAGSPLVEHIDFTLRRLPDATNDDCATARVIEQARFSDLVATFRTSDQGFDPLPSCGYMEYRGRSVWYTYEPPTDGTVTIDTTGSNYDTVVSVLTGGCASLTELPDACNDDLIPGSNLSSQLTLRVRKNTTYYVLVSDWFRYGGMLAFHLNFTPDNRAPFASAGPDRVVNATSSRGAQVALDGSASTDPDGDQLTFSWSGPFGTAAGAAPLVLLPVGTHTVTLVVEDGRGGSATDSVVIAVKGAPEQIADLATAVADIGPGMSLSAKVSKAQEEVAAGNPAGAVSTLRAFINEVEALSGKKLTDAQAAALIEAATRIIAVVGG